MTTTIEQIDKNITALARTLATVLAEQQKTIRTLAKSSLRYMGSVDSFGALPTSPTVGEVWTVDREGLDGMDYVWTGTNWDALGQITFTEEESIINLYNESKK